MINLSILATSTVHIATQRVEADWKWYIIRAAGFVAAGLLILLMLSGIGQVTGFTYRFLEPVKAWTVHKAMAIALCVSITIHGSFLLIDNYLPFSLTQILLPFASHYNNGTKLLGIPLGALAVTMGILAMYGVAIIVASSLGWINTRKGRWRILHYLSYVVMFLVFLHALYIGSDLKYGVFREAWVVIGFVLLIGVLSRLRRVGSLRHKTDTD